MSPNTTLRVLLYVYIAFESHYEIAMEEAARRHSTNKPVLSIQGADVIHNIMRVLAAYFIHGLVRVQMPGGGWERVGGVLPTIYADNAPTAEHRSARCLGSKRGLDICIKFSYRAATICGIVPLWPLPKAEHSYG